jgi:hypothetical protein
LLLELELEFEFELLLELELELLFEFELEFEFEFELELLLELLLEFELELLLELELELLLELLLEFELELLLLFALELSLEFELPSEPNPPRSSPRSICVLRNRVPSGVIGGADLPTPGPTRSLSSLNGPPLSSASAGADAPVSERNVAVRSFFADTGWTPRWLFPPARRTTGLPQIGRK